MTVIEAMILKNPVLSCTDTAQSMLQAANLENPQGNSLCRNVSLFIADTLSQVQEFYDYI